MSRKDKREDRLIKGDEALEKRGIDLDADDETLLPALLAAAGADPDADLSIADLLGSIPREEAARRLSAWEQSNPADKDLRRIIRSSLFRLKQRGIAVPDRAKAPAEPLRPVESPDPRGYLSPIDGAGSRLAWLSRARPGGGLTVLYSLINDRAGMRQIDALHVNRNQFRQILDDSERDSVPMARAPHDYVDWLMQAAYRKGAPREERGGGYPLLRAEVIAGAPREVPCPLDAMIGTAGTAGPADPDEDARLIGASADLFARREFGGWAVPEDLVKVHLARFRDAQDSTLVLNSDQMTDRLTGIVDRAFDELFAGEARPLYAARLREMALWFLLAPAHDDGGRISRTCVALYRALADPGRGLKDAPFLRTLVFRAFVHLMPRAAEGEGGGPEPGDPSGLIVRPG